MSVNLLANTGKFNKAMRAAGQRVKAFSTTLNRAKSAAMGFGGVLAGALTVGAGAAFVRNQLQVIDALGKTSRRLGIATEALGAYQHAAQLSGLDTAQLTTSLERMRDTIGAAMMGESGAIRAFEALGLSAEQIAASQKPLELIQKSMQGIANQNQKLAIVRDIFGRSGAQMLNLFEQNLSKVRKEYERLGLAVTSEEAQMVEEFNDSMLTLSQTMKGVGRRLMIDVGPQVLDAVKGLQIILESTGVIEGKKGKKRSNLQLGGFGGFLRYDLASRAFGELMAPMFQSRQDRINSISSDATMRRRQMRHLEAIRNQTKRPLIAAPANF